MGAFYAFVAGLVFGIGLIVSGMYAPAKMLGFLDLAGNWDPSLALVLAGAIPVGIIAFAVARTRTMSLLGAPMHLPQSRNIDGRLVLGSLVFGAGWGIAGFTPASALVAAGTGHVKAFLFVVAMIAGMAIFELAEKKRAQKTAASQPGVHAHEHDHGAGKHRVRKGH